jgi:hypothetical protein
MLPNDGVGEPMVIDLRDADFWQDPYPIFAEARARYRFARSTGGEVMLLSADDFDTGARRWGVRPARPAGARASGRA